MLYPVAIVIFRYVFYRALSVLKPPTLLARDMPLYPVMLQRRPMHTETALFVPVNSLRCLAIWQDFCIVVLTNYGTQPSR